MCRSAVWGLVAAVIILAKARAEDAKAVSINVFAAQVAGARQLVAACSQNAAACNPINLPGREQVQGGPGGTFYAGWGWLSDGLNAANTASSADRSRQMHEAEAHLEELAAEAGGGLPPGTVAEFAKARAAANAALVRDEFRATEGPTWIQRQMAKVQDWILRLFTGMDRLGRRAPWLAPAIEWACFSLAAAGLLWFVRRSLARQTLRISLSEGAALTGKGNRDSADWARLAQECAAAEDWREAVHCLYWAAIALMEGRRAWKPNATRTPREYLRLLKPDSEAQRALRTLTQIFERIWYGYGEADRQEYETALTAFNALDTARPERSTPSSESSPPKPLPAVAGHA